MNKIPVMALMALHICAHELTGARRGGGQWIPVIIPTTIIITIILLLLLLLLLLLRTFIAAITITSVYNPHIYPYNGTSQFTPALRLKDQYVREAVLTFHSPRPPSKTNLTTVLPGPRKLGV